MGRLKPVQSRCEPAGDGQVNRDPLAHRTKSRTGRLVRVGKVLFGYPLLIELGKRDDVGPGNASHADSKQSRERKKENKRRAAGRVPPASCACLPSGEQPFHNKTFHRRHPPYLFETV